MKFAIHKATGLEYSVSELGVDKVTLYCIQSGNMKVVQYKTFKQQYKLTEGKDIRIVQVPASSREEKKESQIRADEVIKEIQNLGEDDEEEAPKAVKGTKADPKPKEPKVKKTKGPTGAVSLKDICEKLKVDPSKARRILRKHKVDKPGGSWEWTDQQQISKIESLLK